MLLSYHTLMLSCTFLGCRGLYQKVLAKPQCLESVEGKWQDKSEEKVGNLLGLGRLPDLT